MEGEEWHYSVPCALHIYWLRYWKNEDVTVSGYAEGICVMYNELLADFIFKWHSLVPWKVWTCGAESSVNCILTDCKWKEEDGLSVCVPVIGTCYKMKMSVLNTLLEWHWWESGRKLLKP